MQKLRNWYNAFPPLKRRVLLAVGITTLAYLVFSLATIGDLLSPKSIQEIIVNPVPLVLSFLGFLSIFLAWKGHTRSASYLMIASVFVGFIIIAFVSPEAAYSSIAELVVLVIPIMIAIQSLSEREFTWIVILAVLFRSAIQIDGIFKSSSALAGASAQTASLAQWASIVVSILFGLYIALNLNNYSFRVKMILVLGLLTIIPTAILTSITSNNLQSNLIGQANQSLVSSSGQLAASVDSFIQINLDTVRTEAQTNALIDYIDQPIPGTSSTSLLYPRGTDLEKAAVTDLAALVKKDPLNIISCEILDGVGTVQLSTDQGMIGQPGIAYDYFSIPLRTGYPYASPVTISTNGTGIFHISAPIRTRAGITNGVLDISYSASVLQQIITKNGNKLGTGVNAMLLDENNIILAHSAAPDLLYKIINPPDTNTITTLVAAKRLQDLPANQLSVQMNKLTSGLNNLSQIPSFSGNFSPQESQKANGNSAPDQAAATELTSMKWYLVTFVPQSTLLAPVQKQTQNVVFISILISLISIAIALGMTQVLISPILSLTHTSEQIAQGDIHASAQVTTQDEIGELAKTFNSMNERVRDLVSSLEQRVANRTQDLERRAIQLQAAADVGSSAARLRDLNELMRQVTRLISQRFGFYHVGIFLLDEQGEYAILQAANSEGGQRMLARGHKLKVGQVGIVGYVTGTGEARIALNVGEDSAFFTNPDLPATQSEMALPLIAGGRILGALDIQSSQEAAFTEEDVATLKVMADQIAIAIENARLFSENQAAIETAQRAYGNISVEGWQRLLKEKLGEIGYVSMVEDHVVPASEITSSGSQKAMQTGEYVLEDNDMVLHLPVKIRGRSIGAIRMEKPQGSNRWTPETILMADTITTQLGAALESARLYTEITQRAEREYLISEISSKLGSSIRLDSILRTAVEELGNALGDSEIILQVGDQTRRGNDRE